MRTIKTQTALSKQITLWKKRKGGWPGAEPFLNVTCLYEDGVTHKRAMELCDQVERLAGKDAVRKTWWKVGDLAHAGVLAGAVSKAMRAEFIVVALHAVEGQPLPFYVWVNSWWPHHQADTGALVALLGAPDRANPHSGRLRKYLRAVARQGRMEFLLLEQPNSTRTLNAALRPFRIQHSALRN